MLSTKSLQLLDIVHVMEDETYRFRGLTVGNGCTRMFFATRSFDKMKPFFFPDLARPSRGGLAIHHHAIRPDSWHPARIAGIQQGIKCSVRAAPVFC